MDDTDIKTTIKALRRSTASNRYFVPESLFLSILTKERVSKKLSESTINFYQRRKVLQEIMDHGRKIFGILLLTNQFNNLQKFIEADGMDDSKLPFLKAYLTSAIGLSIDDAGDFEEKQWEFIAPTFEPSTSNRRFNEKTILPFKNEKFIAKGHFGRVYETVIDPDHQQPGNYFPAKASFLHLDNGISLTPLQFARKEMELNSDSRKELENLAIISQLKHPNLVRLLGSYTIGSTHNLLFPLARDGSLAKVFATKRELTGFKVTSNLLIALAELSDAIENIHHLVKAKVNLDLRGCHHDLRPRNILVSGSTMILADFGLCEFKKPLEDSCTLFTRGEDDYLAPECEDWENGFRPGQVHRSVDIWAFGCILVEAAIYLALDCEYIAHFRNSRFKKVRGFKLYSFYESGRNLGSAVEGWLSRMETSYGRTCKLLITTARLMLCISQEERIKAREVTIRLKYVALDHLSSEVKGLFSRLQTSRNSGYSSLEHKRFESWVYGAGIYHLESSICLNVHSIQRIIACFADVVKRLTRLQEDLAVTLGEVLRIEKIKIPDITHHNDQLYAFLEKQQRVNAHAHFSAKATGKHSP